MKQKIKAIHNVMTQDSVSQSKEYVDLDRWEVAINQEVEGRNAN